MAFFGRDLIFLFVLLCSCRAQTYVSVTTKNGPVRGVKEHFVYNSYPFIDTTIDIFRGIPFATPPIGDLRFRKPEPVEDWTGTLDATEFKLRCWQDQGTTPQDEDCLYLNIWSPDVTRTNIPVMVWIHGGAFLFGSGILTSYDGRPLVSLNDIVMVSINYRLNAFGFLATGDDELRGNYGLWDQTEALKWIKNNIHAFGGNPDKITIFGQSAGGASVGLQLVGQPSWGYFDKAIPISGNMMSPWAILDINNAREDAFLVGELAGCGEATSGAQLAECLRKVNASELISAVFKVLLTTTNEIPLVPVIDGEFITDHPRKLLAEGKFKPCEIFIGNTKDDGTLIACRTYLPLIPAQNPWSNYNTFREKIATFTYTYTNDVILDAMEQEYVDWTKWDDPRANYFYTYLDIATDEGFHCPSEHVARIYSLAGHKVFRYYFTHLPSRSLWPEVGPSWKGVAHAEDIQFIFGFAFFFSSWEFTPEEVNMTLDMMRYYTNFAKTGDPNSGGDNDGVDDDESVWPEFTVPGLISKDLSPSMPDIQGNRADQCSFWNDLLQELVKYSGSLSDVEREWREEFNQWKTDDLTNWRMSFDTYQDEKDTCT